MPVKFCYEIVLLQRREKKFSQLSGFAHCFEHPLIPLTRQTLVAQLASSCEKLKGLSWCELFKMKMVTPKRKVPNSTDPHYGSDVIEVGE